MTPKDFLFVSMSALIADIALQLSKEGKSVRYYIYMVDERVAGWS